MTGRVQACLNGATSRADHPRVPQLPEELAADAARARAAGASSLHLHAYDTDRRQTLGPVRCAETLAAIHQRVPGLPVGLSTIVSVAGSADAQLATIAAWSAVPDFVSVNFNEPDAPRLFALARERGIAVEAGLWTVADARALVESGLGRDCLRILVEPRERADGAAACTTAAAIEAVLVGAGLDTPQLHHAKGIATWAVLERALRRKHHVRIGLEDTLVHADGRAADGNADLVAAAVVLVES